MKFFSFRIPAERFRCLIVSIRLFGSTDSDGSPEDYEAVPSSVDVKMFKSLDSEDANIEYCDLNKSIGNSKLNWKVG